MSSGVHVVAVVLMALGVAVVVASTAGAVMSGSVLVRLHFLSPSTSLGAPLVGLGLAVQNGWTLTTAIDLFIVALLAVTGPVVEAATARVTAEQLELIPDESPR